MSALRQARRHATAGVAGRRLGLALAAWLLACTDASLYRLDEEPVFPDRLTVTGRICTDDPNRQRFPVRLVLLVDAGPEMAGLDPELRRAAAVDEVVGRYATTPGLAMAIVRFGGRPTLLTDGFSRSAAELNEAAAALRLPAACVAGRCRDLAAALSLAEALVSDDALSAEPGRLVRTRYVFAVLAAGAGDPPLEPDAAGCDEACQLARDLRATAHYVVGLGAREVVFHGLLFAPAQGDGEAQGRARLVFESLTNAGQGQFEERGEAARLRLTELPLLPPSDALVIRSLLVNNTNVLPRLTGPVPDSDGDGLADDVERAADLDAASGDSDGDGLSDFVERLLIVNGLDPLRPDQPEVCLNLAPLVDRDGDGLSDCEERVLGLVPTLTDGDRDGLPDGLELLRGTNPWAADALADPDGDGLGNGAELREHADPLTTDVQGALDQNYRYTFADEGSRPVPYVTGLRQLTGVSVATVGRDCAAGPARLVYAQGEPATLAWQDAGAAAPGPAVPLAGSGRYVLPALATDAGLDRALVVDVVAAELPAASVAEPLLVGLAQRNCGVFTVRNVRLLETADVGRGPGFNRIRLLFSEVPANDPAAAPVFRGAELEVRFVAPDYRQPQGVVTLEDQDFVLLGRWE